MALTPEEEIELLELEIEVEEAEAANPAVSDEDLERGSMASRFDRGITALPRGAFQLGANVGDLINEIPGVSEAASSIGEATVFPLLKAMGVEPMESDAPYGEQINQEYQDYDESRRRGQEALGRGTFDAVGLGGEVLSGGALIKSLAGINAAAGGGAGIGVITPTMSGDNFWEDKAWQTGLGGVGGAAGYGLAKGVGGVGGWIKDAYKQLTSSPEELLARGLRKTLGDKTDDITKLLDADVNPLTKGSAAEVASGAGSTKLSAIQKATDILDSDTAYARKIAQNADRMKVLDDIANVETRGVSPGQFREEITSPMREGALNSALKNTARQGQLQKTLGKLDDSADYTPMPSASHALGKGKANPSMAGAPRGGPDATTNLRSLPNAVRNAAGLRGEKAIADAAAGKASTVTGLPIPKRYAPQQEILENVDDFIADADVIEGAVKAQRGTVANELNAMADYGIEGARPNKIVDGLNAAMKTPNVKGNPTLGRLMTRVQKEIANMVEPDGSVNPEALYTYRKTGLNHTIEQFMKNSDPSMKQSVISELSAIKPLLDDVIDKAAGGGWKEYVKAYSKLSRPVNQANVGKVLKKSFAKNIDDNQSRPAMLANAIEEAEGTLNKAGVRGQTLDDVLNPKQLDKLERLKAGLQREEVSRKMASEASGSGRQPLEIDSPKMANALIRPIMISNHVMRAVMSGKVDAAEEALIQVMRRDPDTGFQALSHMLKNAPPENAKMVRALIDKFGGQAAGLSSGTTAGAVGGQ